MNPTTEEPEFLLPHYVTITRDPRTQLVLAVGGDQRAGGILQTTGGFTRHPGPSTHYHRQPVTMPVEQQRLQATAASYALLAAGYGTFLDPTLNVLTVQDEGREAARRYLTYLSELALNTTEGPVLAAVLAEISAPETGVLHQLRDVLVSVWTSWGNHVPAEPRDGGPVERLMDVTDVLSRKTREIEELRTHAARSPTSATTASPLLPDAGPKRPARRPGP